MVNTQGLVLDSHIQHIVFCPRCRRKIRRHKRVRHRPIKCQSGTRGRRRGYGESTGTHHHDGNPLPKPAGIQIATKFLPGPTTREHLKLIRVKTNVVGVHELQRPTTLSVERVLPPVGGEAPKPHLPPVEVRMLSSAAGGLLVHQPSLNSVEGHLFPTASFLDPR